MDGLQTTTGTDETTLASASETDDEMKGTKKKDRKELFQINTHPAAVISANNKRDRRLKQIVMRVVAFCKKEHEEGQQIPFRFFKKRASAMTGVSLSTIHRIETIDMRFPSPEVSDSSLKPKTKKAGTKKAKKKKKKKEGEEIRISAESVHDTSAIPAQLIPYNDITATANNQIQFQTLPAVSNVPQAPAAKPAKKRKKKVKADLSETESSGVSLNHNGTDATAITSHITTMQPAVLHSVSTIGEAVTTISVHNTMDTAQQRAPCTWTTGHIGPFTVGDLRDSHHVQVPTASHVQVSPQTVPMGSAIPVGAQLQPISMTGSQQAFTGHIDTSNWPASAMGPFSTLQTTATLVGQQVVQTYQNNATAHPNHPQQQQQQSVFYQF